MSLDDLSRLRPLFLAAMVLSWNALLIALNAHREFVSGVVLYVLASANLALAFIAGCVKQAGWARALALRTETDPREVSAVLWIITFFSLSFAVFGFSAAWQLSHPS